jgi:hypothetical protein
VEAQAQKPTGPQSSGEEEEMMRLKHRVDKLRDDLDRLAARLPFRHQDDELWPVHNLRVEVNSLKQTVQAILDHLGADTVDVPGTGPHKKLAIKSSLEVQARKAKK